jgi:hypothetical protein
MYRTAFLVPVAQHAPLRHTADMAQSGELLTAVQAGSILGKSSSTVRRMAESGELAFFQKLPGPNGAFLFRRSVIERYQNAQVAAAAESA